MHHKIHFGDNAFVRVELTKLLVMVADEALQESCTIVFDLGAEQPVYYLHHPEVIAPMLIILWDSVSNQQWQNTTKQPHLSSYNVEAHEQGFVQDFLTVKKLLAGGGGGGGRWSFPPLYDTLIYTCTSLDLGSNTHACLTYLLVSVCLMIPTAMLCH